MATATFDVLSQRAAASQRLQGVLFLFMGGLCVLAPGPVLHLSVAKSLPLDDAVLRLVFQCFGAQACLCGLLLLVAKMDAWAFQAWAMAMLPFLVFDACFWWNGTLTAFGAGGDCLGNLLFIACSYRGSGYAAQAAALQKRGGPTITKTS